jgi:predicted DNA-binding protein YlxM (UPF0122 family)
MEDKIKSGYLYDFYGELLTERQRSVYEMSINEDLSLSEIADTLSISRQAVHDIIKRCDHQLQEYEDKLHLVDKFMHIREDVVRINQLTSSDPGKDTLAVISRLSTLILEEL